MRSGFGKDAWISRDVQLLCQLREATIMPSDSRSVLQAQKGVWSLAVAYSVSGEERLARHRVFAQAQGCW
jgi:hypothetical protein